MQTIGAPPPRAERPPQDAGPAAPDRPSSPPRATRPPLSLRRAPAREPLDRWAPLGSLVAHGLVIALVALFYSELMPPLVQTADRGTDERVEYLDISQFPATGAPGAPAAAATGAASVAGAPEDAPSARREAGEALGRFPTTAPSGIPDPSPGTGAATPTAAGTPGAAGRAGEALRPGYRDDRLYVDPGALRVEAEKSQHQKYMEHLTARIDAINDSVYGESERARKATDWTKTDKEGRRWGLSPEGIHLGGVTVPRALLPIPLATGDNATLDEARQARRAREEIQRQEDDRARRQAQEEAARRTRARKEAEKKSGG